MGARRGASPQCGRRTTKAPGPLQIVLFGYNSLINHRGRLDWDRLRIEMGCRPEGGTSLMPWQGETVDGIQFLRVGVRFLRLSGLTP